MTADEAKFILASFRPNTEDANDPHFAEAIGVMEREPTLQAWLENEVALADALSLKLNEIHVPEGLRTDILAGAKATVSSKRRWPRFLAIAAAFLVAGFSVAVWLDRFVPSGPVNMAAYRTDMGAFMARTFISLDYTSENLGDIKTWLAEEHSFTDYTIPAALEGHPSLGCEVIDWHGKTAYLICFDVHGELVHLFTLPETELEGAPLDSTPLFAAVDDWATLSWKENNNIYLVTTLGDEAYLRGSLKPTEA